jgi:DNA repair protein RecO (recombination protein O)
MSQFSTSAIMIRRIEHGDYDLIITLFTLNQGKLSVIAKAAKKSVKRFSGILEPFYELQVVCNSRRGKGLPVLQEAVLKHSFSGIRGDMVKTAYASYWAELIREWMEEGARQDQIYRLLLQALSELDRGHVSTEMLSLFFQMRFMGLSGFGPNLRRCHGCQTDLAHMKQPRVIFDLARGALVCEKCASETGVGMPLAKGTIKQLQWIQTGDFRKALRMKLSSLGLNEGLTLLEAYVPFHLEKNLRSLKFINQLRAERNLQGRQPFEKRIHHDESNKKILGERIH